MGHALAALTVAGVDPVHKISIVQRGYEALGHTLQLPSEDHYLRTRDELHHPLAVWLGGRAAEEMIFGDVSTGAQNDLQRATEIARTMVTQFGMSEKLGLESLEGPRTPMFLSVPTINQKEYSEMTAQLIDEEVNQILAQAHEKATKILSSNRTHLEELAQLLLEKEVVDRPELLGLLKVRNLDGSKEKERVAGIQRIEGVVDEKKD